MAADKKSDDNLCEKLGCFDNVSSILPIKVNFFVQKMSRERERERERESKSESESEQIFDDKKCDDGVPGIG